MLKTDRFWNFINKIDWTNKIHEQKKNKLMYVHKYEISSTKHYRYTNIYAFTLVIVFVWLTINILHRSFFLCYSVLFIATEVKIKKNLSIRYVWVLTMWFYCLSLIRVGASHSVGFIHSFAHSFCLTFFSLFINVNSRTHQRGEMFEWTQRHNRAGPTSQQTDTCQVLALTARLAPPSPIPYSTMHIW